MSYRLVPQMYGVAMAQVSFGGPRGIWLECTAPKCLSSDRIADVSSDLPDAECEKAFRENGWTGEGPRLLKAKCPKCSALTDKDSKEC